MSGLEDPSRRWPADIWAMSGEHSSRRHNGMLPEHLQYLAAMPDTRRRALRGLMNRLQAMWSRSSARHRLPGLSPGTENDEAGISTRWRGQWTATNKSWTWTPTTESSPRHH